VSTTRRGFFARSSYRCLRNTNRLSVSSNCHCSASWSSSVRRTSLHLWCCGRHQWNGPSCRKSAGRLAPHNAINHVIHRALLAAQIPSRLEPVKLCHRDDKRPDGVSTMPWSRGECITWDFTCPDTPAASHLNRAVTGPGEVANEAECKKTAKYAELTNR